MPLMLLPHHIHRVSRLPEVEHSSRFLPQRAWPTARRKFAEQLKSTFFIYFPCTGIPNTIQVARGVLREPLR